MAVMCTVNNCHYWAERNRCRASSILIVSDSIADDALDTYDAMQAENAAPTPVDTCMATACKTFVQGDESITDDHITPRIY
ncbi:MAG: DUF1540 domain-containing protein [Desulforudis sp.]|nr:DUF1540 domain-containing protein [Clostridia bacterium]MDQ7791883.1 DUF1540 domain-containing protein [Clostridia bacterium]RJX22119.1 MAG: DUF1540 domain-containing protein [Desulforudis sp.]